MIVSSLSLLFFWLATISSSDGLEYTSRNLSRNTNTSTAIPLGNKRPEGITEGPGSAFFVSEALYGGVKKVSAKTGAVTQKVPSFGYLERQALGLWYSHGAIWVAGGGPLDASGLPVPAVHVYDADDGSEIVSCPIIDAIFVNDVTVRDGAAYFTDSGVNVLYKLDVHDALHERACNIHYVMLPVVPFLPSGPGQFVSNGIVGYRDGLIVGTIDGSGVYFVDLANTNESYQIISGLSFTDGLARRGNKLYVVESEVVSVFKLKTKKMNIMNDKNAKTVSTERIGSITSASFDGAATVAIYGPNLYVTNLRFFSIGFPAVGEDDLETFKETFDVVVVPRIPR